jgi:MoxR-like ATPase
MPNSDIEKIIKNVENVIVGKRETIELLLVALLCNGHVLIEDVPGLGKTMLARAVATSIGGAFKRLQCTPDLLPNDITGISVFNQLNRDFEFRPGPLFVNVLLADEINRATPRSQSALLEAMQEQQVTVDGVTHLLPQPFIVLATQNPIEFEGTFPLPEAQIDRFLLRINIGYTTLMEEIMILRNLRREHPINFLKPVVEPEIIRKMQKEVWEVYVESSLEEYIVNLVTNTRKHPDILLGSSPRGSLALYKAAQAFAYIVGRDFVLPDDIQKFVPYVLLHRLIMKADAELRGRTTKGVLADILEQTPLEIKPGSTRQ